MHGALKQSKSGTLTRISGEVWNQKNQQCSRMSCCKVPLLLQLSIGGNGKVVIVYEKHKQTFISTHIAPWLACVLILNFFLFVRTLDGQSATLWKPSRSVSLCDVLCYIIPFGFLSYLRVSAWITNYYFLTKHLPNCFFLTLTLHTGKHWFTETLNWSWPFS